MIEYDHIYFINKTFSLETKNIYIFSVLEDALSTKCILFYGPSNFVTNKKAGRDTDKIGVILHLFKQDKYTNS